MKLRSYLAVILIGMLLALAACNLPQPPPQEISPQDAVNTSAARTVAALSTELAAGRSPTLAGPTRTPQPTSATPGSSENGNTGGQDAPTPTLNNSSNSGGPTVDPDAPCNRGGFVGDVTIPDGSVLPPNSPFTKTWELRNTGSCTWNSSYSVVFAGSGSSMSGPATTPLVSSGEVRPGETVFVSVPLRAPGEKGEYRGSWWLRDPQGNSFGLGPNATGTFYVEIMVEESYSFADLYCSAVWSTGAGTLPCPGKENDALGTIVRQENPRLENGSNGDGTGLLVVAEPVAGGYIVGRYPPVMVPNQADFRAQLGCRDGASGCFVRFKLTAQVDNGPEQTLGEWNEGLDGNLTQAIVDLDSFSGKPTAFNLYVYVNGAPEASKAVWFNPRIVK